MRYDQLCHERLQTEVFILFSLLAYPPFRETNYLSEVVLLQHLPDANELEVERNARKHRVSAVEWKQIAPIIGIAAVLDRNNIHIEATDRIANADGVSVHGDLIGFHLRVSFPNPLRQPVQKLSLFAGDLLALHVEGDVNVVQYLQRRALRKAAGEQGLDQPMFRVICCIPVKLVAQVSHLLAVFFRVLAFEVDAIRRELLDLCMTDKRGQRRTCSSHRPPACWGSGLLSTK